MEEEPQKPKDPLKELPQQAEPFAKFRPATIDDIDFLATTSAELALNTEQKKCDLENIKNLTLDQLLNSTATDSWIAETNDEKSEYVGNFCIIYEYNIPTNSYSTWLTLAYVLEEFRNKKVFSQFFKFFKHKSEEMNFSRIKLSVEENNEKAIQVYHHFGMYFPKCEIYDVDFVFMDNGKDGIVRKIDQNFLTFKGIFQKHKTQINAPTDSLNYNFELIHLERGPKGLSKFQENFNSKINFREFESVINCKDLENCKIEDMDNGLNHYFSNDCKSSSLFLLTLKRSDREEKEIVGVLSTFEEFCDWRSGIIHWVYDLRFKSEYREIHEDMLVYLNRCFLEFMKNGEGKCFRWQVYSGDPVWIKRVLIDMGFSLFSEKVMYLDL